MRTIQVLVYTFGELSASAKQTAKDNYASLFGYSWETEAMASIKKLAEHFGGRMKEWEVDFFNNSYSSASFDMPDMDPEEISERLQALGTYDPETLKGNGECKLTGFCADEDAIDSFRFDFIRRGVNSLDLLMQAAFATWLKAAQDDCKDQYTDEQFAEHCEANGYEFTEAGQMTK